MAVNKPDLRRIWAAGAPALNVQDPDDVEAGKFNSGWVAEIPPFEFFNFLQQLFTQALAHISERGVAEWDADTEYLGSRSYATGSDGEIYIAVITNTGNDPTIDGGTNWITLRDYIVDSIMAHEVGYDHSTSGLIADNMQDAIDEVVDRIDNLDITPTLSDVRQTVNTGPVDVDGRADYIIAGTGLQALTNGLDTLALNVTFGAGFDAFGKVDLNTEIDANLSWVLADDTTNYLILQLDTSDNSVSAIRSSSAPVYSLARPAVGDSNNQIWYPIDHRQKAERWDSGLAEWVDEPTLYYLVVGESTTSSGSVTESVSYAYQGLYRETLSAPISLNTAYSFVHNIGTELVSDKHVYMAGFTTRGYSATDRIDLLDCNVAYGAANNTRQLSSMVDNKNSFLMPLYVAGASSVYAIASKTGGEGPSITLGDFVEASCRRAF